MRIKLFSKKGNGVKSTLSVLLGFVLVTTIASMAPGIDAEAATSKKTMNMVSKQNPAGSVAGCSTNYIYFGSNTSGTNNFDGRFRVLDATHTNTGSSGMFLLSENLAGDLSNGYGGIMFRNNNTGTEYQGSLAQSWCTSFYNSTFSTQEKNAILATTKSDTSVTNNGIPTKASANILNGDRVFLPSEEEMYNSAYGFTSDEARKALFKGGNIRYWTRNAHATLAAYAVGINYNGKAKFLGVSVDAGSLSSGAAARPAFNLNLSKVLFTSAATSGKTSGTVGANSLTAVNSYSGTEWKLTLLDSARGNFNASISDFSNNVATIAYSGASYGTNEYVSAIVVNSLGDITYYGNLVAVNSSSKASGTVTVNLSGKYQSGDTLYIFSEQCNGNKKTDYSSALKQIDIVTKVESPTPVLTKLDNGVKVTWTAVKGAGKYRVYRKSTTENWNKGVVVSGTEYTDTTCVLGNEYTYLIRCLSSDGTTLISDFDSKKTATILYANPVSPTPVLTMVSNGVKVTWPSQAGITKYRVYRKIGNGSWNNGVVVTGTEYMDTTCELGNAYTYLIRCVSSDGKSLISTFDAKKAATISYCNPTSPTPSVMRTPDGVQVTWNEQPGVIKYRVYRKTVNGSWNGGVVVTGTGYIDTTCVLGNAYTYLVRCVSADGKTLISVFDAKKSATISYADPVSPTPTVTKTPDGVQVTWNAQPGVIKYRVYRKTVDGNWNGGVTVTGTGYLDTTCVMGNAYTYLIRCVSADGKTLISTFDAKKAVTISYAEPVSPTPVLTKTTAGVGVNWTAQPGVIKYRVYRKTGSGSWNGGVVVSGTQYTDNTCVKGNEYTYLVRCVSADGKTLISVFDSSKSAKINY